MQLFVTGKCLERLPPEVECLAGPQDQGQQEWFPWSRALLMTSYVIQAELILKKSHNLVYFQFK